MRGLEQRQVQVGHPYVPFTVADDGPADSATRIAEHATAVGY